MGTAVRQILFFSRVVRNYSVVPENRYLMYIVLSYAIVRFCSAKSVKSVKLFYRLKYNKENAINNYFFPPFFSVY